MRKIFLIITALVIFYCFIVWFSGKSKLFCRPPFGNWVEVGTYGNQDLEISVTRSYCNKWLFFGLIKGL